MKLKTLANQKTLAVAVLLTLFNGAAIAAPVGTLTTFSAGTTAQAAQVNGNFTTVSAAVNDNDARINTLQTTVTGGNIVLVPSTATTGNILKGTTPFLHNFGTENTFIGVNAGNFTMTGIGNTASGTNALFANTTGSSNTASGRSALEGNQSGHSNTANGYLALLFNTTGSNNTASGRSALQSNTTGGGNTAIGYNSLPANTIGGINTAIGVNALAQNSTGNNNTALGAGTLYGNTTGSNNIAVGLNAGLNLTTGNNNIVIGHAGQAGNLGAIRIGTPAVQTSTFIAGITGVGLVGGVAVVVDANGQLGIASSSQRTKDDIADMGEASSTMMKLRPVTFHYKSDQNPKGRALQYGLIAEEVEKVAPNLVARNANGEIETVFYQHLTPMLLNEYQKQQRTIDTQAAALQKQTLALAQQTQRVAALEQQGQEIVALRQELSRMEAMLARLGQPEKLASVSR